MNWGKDKTEASGRAIEEWVVSFLSAFLLLIYFSLYRQFRGIPFAELRSGITAEYPKFLLVFCGAGLFAYLVFCRWLKNRRILDCFLFFGGNLALILIGWFSQGSLAACIVLFLLSAVLARCFFRGEPKPAVHLTEKQGLLAVLGIVLLYSLCAASVGIVRHRIFLSSGNDLGTFDQMFYAMGKTLRPLNTVTGVQINQFTAVHFSPILYLLLPGYLVFPSPEYLIFVQSLFSGLAAIPLFKLCIHKKAGTGTALLIVTAFLLQPGILGGQFKDFHENALLPFFLLGFIYFFEKQRQKPMLIFLLLTLMVKEDAAIYTICFGLCALFRKTPPRRQRFFVILFSGVYFLIVSAFVLDTGTFAYRYASLIPEQTNGSFFEIVKILLTNPLYLFTQSFTAEKLIFLGWIFLPLALIPLSGLFRISEIPLFFPILLLPDFYGQYSIDFQYHFGTISLLIWICVQRFAHLPEQRRHALGSLLLASALIFSAAYHQPKSSYFSAYREHAAEYQAMSEAMENIPETAAVSATNHLYPHLSHRYEVYPFGFRSDTEFIAVDLRGEDNPTDFTAVRALLTANKAYGVKEFAPDWFLILEKGISGTLDAAAANYLQSRIK